VTHKKPVDAVGLVFLIVAVGSLQNILDLEKNNDRFQSPVIVCDGATRLSAMVFPRKIASTLLSGVRLAFFALPIASIVWEKWCKENPIRIGRIEGQHPKRDRWTGSEWHESRTGCEKPHRPHTGQSIASPTNEVFLGCAVLFVTTAIAIWFAPKPARITGPSWGH